jgi:hypothetical protein
VECQIREAVGRGTETAELKNQNVACEAAILCVRKRLGRGSEHAFAGWEEPFDQERLVLRSGDRDCEGLLRERRGGLKIGAREAIEIRIVSAPDEITGTNPGEIEGAVGEAQLTRITGWKKLIKTAALFGFLGTAPGSGVEYEAIAGLKRSEARGR